MPAARRTLLAALSLVLALVGAQVDAWTAQAGESIFDIWPPLLLASAVPPALSAGLHGRRRAQRSMCWLGVLVTGPVALVLIPYGYGVWELPAVIALAMAGATRD